MVCRPSCGPCVGNGSRFRVGVLVWKRSWALGFLFLGVRGVVWVCFWAPGPPPATCGRVRFPDAPGGTPSALRAAGRVLSGRVVV